MPLSLPDLFSIDGPLPTEEDLRLSVKEITPGDGKTFPQKGQTVSVHFEGKFENADRSCYSTRHKGRPLKFVVGEGIVVKGLEDGIRQMSVGERAKIICSGKYISGSTSIKKTKPISAFEHEWRQFNPGCFATQLYVGASPNSKSTYNISLSTTI